MADHRSEKETLIFGLAIFDTFNLLLLYILTKSQKKNLENCRSTSRILYLPAHGDFEIYGPRFSESAPLESLPASKSTPREPKSITTRSEPSPAPDNGSTKTQWVHVALLYLRFSASIRT